MLAQNHKDELLKSIPATELGLSVLNLNFFSLSDELEIRSLLQIKTESKWKRSPFESGWAVRGVEPLTGEPNSRGCQFKPDQPRFDDARRRIIKYESPRDASHPLFLDTGDSTFWVKVKADRKPTWFVEGAKKAAALMALGVPAVSIPGVDCCQKQGVLNEAIAGILSPGATVILGFDMDWLSKPGVRGALKRFGRLLIERAINVKVAIWDEGLKGIDDFLMGESEIEGYRTPEERLEKIGYQTFEKWLIDIKPLELESAKSQGFDWNLSVKEKLFPAAEWICLDGHTLYQWVGTHYKQVKDCDALNRIAEYAETIEVESRSGKVTRPYAKMAQIKEALGWAKTRRTIMNDDPRWNPPGINCTNGVLRWSREKFDFEFVPHSPEYFYIHEPTFKYDPHADDSACNTMLSALDVPQQEVLLRTMSIPLDAEYVRSKIYRMRMLIAQGVGSNGKDTHREAFSLLYGRNSCTAVPLSIFDQYDNGRQFGVSILANSRINWASENSNKINLSGLDSLKAAITGDPLTCEKKGQDATEFFPRTVFVFNTNDIPRLDGASEADKSRIAILTYNKTYSPHPDPAKAQIKADPRFKEDPDFIKKNVLPALLNKVTAAFKRMIAEGEINYDACNEAMQQTRIHNSHLYEFAIEYGLIEDADAEIQVGKLWEKLEEYYVKTEVLKIGSDGSRRWDDPIRPGDQWIKSSNQIPTRLLKLFPKITRIADMGANKKGLKGLRFMTEEEMRAKNNLTAAAQPQPELVAHPQPVEAQPIETPAVTTPAHPQEPIKIIPTGTQIRFRSLEGITTGIITKHDDDPQMISGSTIVYHVQNGRPEPYFVPAHQILLE